VNNVEHVKGLEGGSCNVTACQSPHSAHYYNRVMDAWYCLDCATEIERFARFDGMSLFDNLEREVVNVGTPGHVDNKIRGQDATLILFDEYDQHKTKILMREFLGIEEDSFPLTSIVERAPIRLHRTDKLHSQSWNKRNEFGKQSQNKRRKNQRRGK